MTETNPMVEALEAALKRAHDMDASLNERLQVIADEVRAQSTSFADAVEWLIARLKQSNEAFTLPIPATFVIGMDGIIRARHVDPDYRRGMETEDLLASLKAAREVRKH